MSYIYDAIMESNQLEDEQVLSKLKAEKNPPTLKRRLQIDEECKEDKEECNPEDKEETLSEEYEELDEEKLTPEIKEITKRLIAKVKLLKVSRRRNYFEKRN